MKPLDHLGKDEVLLDLREVGLGLGDREVVSLGLFVAALLGVPLSVLLFQLLHPAEESANHAVHQPMRRKRKVLHVTLSP